MVMYKYTYWLIRNSTFTQYTHKICDKNLRFLLVYMLYRYKTMWHETACYIKLMSQKYIYVILTWSYVLYDTQMSWIITIQSSQRWSFCRGEYIPMHRHWMMSSLLSIPCDCVPMNIVMKEGKGKLKHLKNLLKENEIHWQNIPQWWIIDVDAFHVYNLA